MQYKPTVRVQPYMLQNAYAFQAEVRRVLVFARMIDEKNEFLYGFPRIEDVVVTKPMITHALRYVELNLDEI